MRYFLSKVGLGVDDQTATEELETGSTQRYFKWKTGDEKALMTYTGDIGMCLVYILLYIIANLL